MIRELSFTELAVADWSAAVAWYRDVLGLEVVLQFEADRFALLRAGGARLALKAGQPEPGTVRLVFEVDDLTAELDRLARLHVLPEGPVKTSPEGYWRALLCDPDGHQLTLFQWSGVGERPQGC
jgi:catechol 2,3-dioxygenase-like lactoylglutathione lyase family enzyme